ncbi:MAG TPA: hypothetical protein DCM28_08580 [Phycisphaerales bacterium]|nr:hypothetical protein [Phycisphaerales bacterium]HCD34958.1 hypothetical protein [Phycisphaerales bacterium]|tara:strand:- start:48 stop:1016 length:969 start_codon:yes stop_codon:yes gene_type:complete
MTEHSNQPDPIDPRLTDAIDQWLDLNSVGVRPDQGSDEQIVEDMLSNLDHWEVPVAPDSLILSTLDRIDQYEEDQRTSMMFESRRRLPSLPITMPEVAAIAAMILMAISLGLPMLTRHRNDARRFACESNLATAGVAMGHYANDYNGVMPRGDARPGSAWWKVGKESDNNIQSNSANLYLLAREHYINPQSLSCPNNEDAPKDLTRDMHDWPEYNAVSYSYQNQYSKKAIKLNQNNQLAVLADKNPLFYADGKNLHHLADFEPNLPSMRHNRQGQNILLASGSVQWSRNPVVRGDNIWLVSGIDDYTGNEAPRSINDAFLVP